jgi:hypothetical protein
MSVVRVLEEDPDLHERVPEPDRSVAAAEAIASIEHLPPGIWREPPSEDVHGDGFGLLVLDGVLARRVAIGRFDSTELLGQGDLLRPWSSSTGSHSSVSSEVSWNVVAPVRLAKLDRKFVHAVAPWPEIAATLMDRVVQRSRWLAFQLAVCHVVRVEMRLLMVLWHFADRWGRMTPNGARLHLPITHSVLASVVGARRPSVTTALGKLQDDGLIQRLPGGSWLLVGEPPADYGRVTLAASEPA